MKPESRLSLLWIFVTLNYLYCDVLTLMDSSALKEVLSGTVGGLQITPGFLLGAAILMEIPIAMVLLSRLLKQKANRWANLIAAGIMTVVQLLSLLVGTPTMYYAFFSVIEIATTGYIAYFAWSWKD